MSMQYKVKIQAMGEVRDAEGNLVSTPVFESEEIKTGAELNQLSLEPHEEK